MSSRHCLNTTRGQSDAGRTGIFSRGTNRTQDARVYSHEGPIGRRTHGYILIVGGEERAPSVQLEKQQQGIRAQKGCVDKQRKRGYSLLT
eukprot:1179202-Prorocentrum_minimum.AAC.3